MSPMSLLTLPSETLQSAMHGGQLAPHGERRERVAALVAVGLIVCGLVGVCLW